MTLKGNKTATNRSTQIHTTNHEDIILPVRKNQSDSLQPKLEIARISRPKTWMMNILCKAWVKMTVVSENAKAIRKTLADYLENEFWVHNANNQNISDTSNQKTCWYTYDIENLHEFQYAIVYVMASQCSFCNCCVCSIIAYCWVTIDFHIL